MDSFAGLPPQSSTPGEYDEEARAAVARLKLERKVRRDVLQSLGRHCPFRHEPRRCVRQPGRRQEEVRRSSANLCPQAKQEDFDEQIRQELDGTVRATAKVSC